MTFRKSYRRGYPVAMLIGFSEDKATIWRVFSHVVKPEKTLAMDCSKNDPKVIYNFYESIVNALRHAMKEGVRSVILAAPQRTNTAMDFLNHVKEHHAWLGQGAAKVSFAEVAGSAVTAHDVTVLTRTPQFRQLISETTTEETDNIIDLLEKRLNTSGSEQLVLYSLEEIENAVYSPRVAGKPKPELVILTDTYLLSSRQKNRLQRLQQIAANRGVKTKVVRSDSAAGKRVLQFGGLVCILNA